MYSTNHNKIRKKTKTQIEEKNLVPRTYRFQKKSKFCESQIDTNKMFLYFLEYSGDNPEVSGPDFDIFFKVARIIQKVLEYDRGP